MNDVRGAPSPNAANVSAIVVTYHPELPGLETILSALRPQVGRVVIVDNGSHQPTVVALRALAARYSCVLEPLDTNLGIAAAQNKGVEVSAALAAGEEDAHYLLFLDHDSIPSSDMVERLLATDTRLRGRGEPVGAIGPVIVDKRTGTSGRFICSKRFWISRDACASGCKEIATDFLISSGTLVRLDVFRAVGPMNEGLFIDHVDTEWCLRALTLGLRLFGACDSNLTHSLGDEVVPVWMGRWREVFVHSPVRDYYMCRNTVLLLRDVRMSFAWRMFLTLRLLGSIGFFGFGVAPRGTRLRQMWRGLMDGMAGRSGALGA